MGAGTHVTPQQMKHTSAYATTDRPQAAAGVSPGMHAEWRRNFEELFGQDCGRKLRENGLQQMLNPMMNLIYERVKQKGLSQGDMVNFDSTLARLFQPFVGGARNCKQRDILLLVQRAATSYSSASSALPP